jgi:predicted transcriptional regulator
MADEETFILVSLAEQKSKELAQVISNDTSRKILDYLGKKEGSESEISKILNVPLSTIHYNMQQLLKAGLIENKEFVYSNKGKEMNIYTISKKLIIIAPNKQSNIKDILKGLIPFVLISAGIGIAIQKISEINQNNLLMTAVQSKDFTAPRAEMVSGALANHAQNAIPNYGLWFFFGALFVILIYLFYAILRKK